MGMFEAAAAKSQKKRGRQLDKIFDALYITNGSFLNTTERLAMFVAQLAHETGGFKWLYELGGPRYLSYLEGRKDLGNVNKGDGVKYKGRGLIHITGRYNYEKYGKRLGFDLIGSPDLAEDLTIAMLIALEFWRENEIFKLEDDVKAVTRRVNGGYNGLKDRTRRYNELVS